MLYLCGCAWILAGLLSTPNIFIFHLHVKGPVRSCTAIFTRYSSPTGRRIYLTFISLIVYFIPFFVLVFCYTLIFIKLLCREHDHRGWFTSQTPSSSYCCSRFCRPKTMQLSNIMHLKGDRSASSKSSSMKDNEILRKRVHTYAKARSKTFRMVSLKRTTLWVIEKGHGVLFRSLYWFYLWFCSVHHTIVWSCTSLTLVGSRQIWY